MDKDTLIEAIQKDAEELIKYYAERLSKNIKEVSAERIEAKFYDKMAMNTLAGDIQELAYIQGQLEGFRRAIRIVEYYSREDTPG